MDSPRTYGERILIHRVTRLSPTEFEEELASVVEPFASGPYRYGVHTLSAVGARALVAGLRVTVEQFHALARQDRGPDPWEVVISDNESSDDLRRIVRLFESRLPGLRVSDASDRHGRAHARNVGVEAAKHEAVAPVDAVRPEMGHATAERLRPAVTRDATLLGLAIRLASWSAARESQAPRSPSMTDTLTSRKESTDGPSKI